MKGGQSNAGLGLASGTFLYYHSRLSYYYFYIYIIVINFILQERTHLLAFK